MLLTFWFLCGENGLPHQCAHWFAMTSLVGMRAAGQWCNVLRLSQGTRIATPVCALVRNDMQKEGRVRGCKDVLHCHCEERSDVAIRVPAAGHSKEQYLRRTRKSVTNLP